MFLDLKQLKDEMKGNNNGFGDRLQGINKRKKLLIVFPLIGLNSIKIKFLLNFPSLFTLILSKTFILNSDGVILSRFLLLYQGLLGLGWVEVE